MEYKLQAAVHKIAITLLTLEENMSSDSSLQEQWQAHYNELSALCHQHEQESEYNHPAQWETLADFTEELDAALALYQKAVAYAEALDAKTPSIAISNILASSAYAAARLLQEQSNLDQAKIYADKANQQLAIITDTELKQEIRAILKKLPKK